MSKLQELKVGDKVVVMLDSNKRISTIEKITKLYITVDSIRYNRRYGWATGYCHRSTIRPLHDNEQGQ